MSVTAVAADPSRVSVGQEDPMHRAAPLPVDFHALVALIERSPISVPGMAAAALAHGRDGVIAGEGPAVRGHVRCSRRPDPPERDLDREILDWLVGHARKGRRAAPC